MGKCVYGNTVGAGGGLPKSFLLETEGGVQLVGVTVGEETVLTATDNDVRENLVYAGDKGLSVGKKFIPSYYTTEGIKMIRNGAKVKITNLSELNLYSFTKLQAIICDYNTSMSNSVSARNVSIDSNVYAVQSVTPLAKVTINDTDQTIDFGITNDTGSPVILRFFTYKEIY